MAVAAINPVVLDMMLVAERDGLLPGNIDVGEIGRFRNGPPKVAERGHDKHRTVNTHTRNCIGAAMKNLSHFGSTNKVPKSELCPPLAVLAALARSRAKLSVCRVLN